MHPLGRGLTVGFGVQRDIAGEILELRRGGLPHAEMPVDAVHHFGDGEPRRQFAEGKTYEPPTIVERRNWTLPDAVDSTVPAVPELATQGD